MVYILVYIGGLENPSFEISFSSQGLLTDQTYTCIRYAHHHILESDDRFYNHKYFLRTYFKAQFLWKN